MAGLHQSNTSVPDAEPTLVGLDDTDLKRVINVNTSWMLGAPANMGFRISNIIASDYTLCRSFTNLFKKSPLLEPVQWWWEADAC